MKKLSLVLAVLLVLTMLPTFAVSAEVQDLIPNGDFELVGEDGFATGWTRSSDTCISVKTVADASGNADNKVVAFVKPEARQNIKLTTDVENYPVDPTKEYVMSFDAYRTAGGSNFNVKIQYRNADSDKIKDTDENDVYWEQLSQEATRDAWKHFEFAVNDIPEETRIFEITFQNTQNSSTSESAAELYFDNISIKEKEAGSDDEEVITNLIANPGFEQVDVNGWAVDWTKASDDSVIVEDPIDGDKCLAVYTKGKEISYQIPSISPDKDYELSVNIYRPDTGAKWKAIVYFYDIEDNGAIYSFDTAVDGGDNQGGGRDGWENKKFRINNIPETAVRAKVSVRASQTADVLYYDDIYFGEVVSNVAYTVTDAEEITTPITDLTAGTVNVIYNANLNSSYTEETVPNIVAVAVLYKTDGSTKSLVGVSISDETPLVKGASTPIDLRSFDVPEVDTDKYSIRVFSFESVARFDHFEKFPALVPATPAA